VEIAKLAIDHIKDGDRQIKLLIGIKGIDYYAAMTLLSEIGDITRFATPRGWSHGRVLHREHTSQE
jgi:hypothetical protein